MIKRVAYLAAGVLAVAIALLLTWFDLTLPLNLRQPAVSPDGSYFAYFDRVRQSAESESDYDLIISTPAGEAVARYSMEPGTLSWSSAGHLMVERKARHHVTLIPNAAGSFVILTTLNLSPGTQPVWARSGTKFAFIRTGSAGLEIAVYDLLQTQSTAVPLAASIHLDHPTLLFWSPGGQELYFADGGGNGSVLYRANVITGEASPIAQTPAHEDWPIPGSAFISSDGARIFLPELKTVIDTNSGAVQCTLPKDAAALSPPWSADGSAIYFEQKGTGKIFAHDFAKNSDREVIGRFLPYGYFVDDDRSYLFRYFGLQPWTPYGSRLRAWLRADWDWRELEVATGKEQLLGRRELAPWIAAQNGAIPAIEDNIFSLRYGLFDLRTRTLSPFHFPTDREDLRRALTSRAVLILTLSVYVLLGFGVFFAKPASAPARALYILSLVLMLLFVTQDLARSAQSVLGSAWNDPEPTNHGWFWSPRAVFLANQAMLWLVFSACVPLALLRFALTFPERSRFLSGRRIQRALLYILALIPLGAMLALIPPSPLHYVGYANLLEFSAVVGGAAAIAAAFLALFYNHRHPPDRRAREQIRWVLIAFSGPLAATIFFLASQYVNAAVSRPPEGMSFAGYPWLEERLINAAMSAGWLGPLWLFTPLAIVYALLSHKLFDMRLLYQRTVRYTALTSVVAVVYVLLAFGISWVIYGSLGKPSMIVLVISTVLTAIILAPARNRLERVIDRNISREHFDFQETLQSFAQGLPGITDRRTLATVTSRMVRSAMKTQAFHLFIMDRMSGKLRMEEAESETKGAPRGVSQHRIEFDPGEPLCRFLLERSRPFEVEVSPYDPGLIPIFQSASDRISSLRAAIIFGLVRRRQLVGLMALGDKTTDEFYNSEDIRLLQNVARQAAIAVEKTEVFEEAAREQEVGTKENFAAPPPVQFSPAAAPQIESAELAGCSAAAPSGGGDFYDYVALPGGKVGVAVGCVSGKGAAATALKVNLQSLLKTGADNEKDLPSMVRRINRQLFTSFRGAKYCAFLYCVYEPRERRLEYVNAGHNPPLVLGPKGIRSLASAGVPLGLFAETTHEARLVSLEQGASLVLFSDGVTSARDRMGELFGLDRVMASVTRAAGQGASGMVEKILNDIREFTDRLPLEEDRTVVVLKLT